VDFGQHEKELKNHFTFDHFLGLWMGHPIDESFWAEPGVEPIGSDIWAWIDDFVTAAPSFAGENPGIIGDLYEEGLLLNHKKNHGIFYTPANIAAYMAMKAVKKIKVGENIKKYPDS